MRTAGLELAAGPPGLDPWSGPTRLHWWFSTWSDAGPSAPGLMLVPLPRLKPLMVLVMPKPTLSCYQL